MDAPAAEAPAKAEAPKCWAICADTNEPIKALAVAMILQASRDAQRDPAALEWLLSEDSHLWFDVLGIHPDRIAAWIARNFKPLQRRKRPKTHNSHRKPHRSPQEALHAIFSA